MLNLRKIIALGLMSMSLVACNSQSVEEDDDFIFRYIKSLEDCPSCGETEVFDEDSVRFVPDDEEDFVFSDAVDIDRTTDLSGRAYCTPRKRCNGVKLPPRPCTQPMPSYYNNVTSEQIEHSVVLLHPYTRAKILCIDDGGDSAVMCANSFRNSGYILITDIPQVPAKYDFLRDGTYPTRRWRNGGEVVPRW